MRSGEEIVVGSVFRRFVFFKTFSRIAVFKVEFIELEKGLVPPNFVEVSCW